MTWNREIAEWYAERYGEYATNRLAVDEMAVICASDRLEPTTVLDIGCGAGAALRHAAGRWPAARLVGVDPVDRMVEIAGERLLRHPHEQAIEFRVGSAEALPVPDHGFDLVLAFDSLDHWRDAAVAAREIARVLAPEGRVVVVKDRGAPGHGGEAVESLAAAAGLEVIEQRSIEAEQVAFRMWVLADRATEPDREEDR